MKNLVGAGIILAVFLAAGCGESPPGQRKSATPPAWQYPPGDAQKTAREIPLDQLIARWKSLPPEKSKYLVHATYAEAIGLYGEQAVGAIPALEPYVTDEKQTYLRQGAMKGLAGIGPAGVPALVGGLRHRDGDVRWDAAMALATMGPAARAAIPALEERLLDPKEGVSTKTSSAEALVSIGSEAVDALKRAREWFYSRGGLSPGETGVLRTINLGLRGLDRG